MQPLITCKGLTLAYDTGIAVKDVSFELCAGDYLCVVGENGSGKSTLIKGLLALMTPSAGEITYHGLKAGEIGYLPQQTPVQKDFPASVYEVVLSGCQGSRGLSPFYGRSHHSRANEMLAQMSITDLKYACYRELSGGQQQRVLLARALCATTRLLLLDEPVSGLDPLATSELYERIKRLNRENGITIIMVSHDVSCALHDATHVLHLGEHEVRFFGSAQEYHSSAVSAPFLRCECERHREGAHGGNS
ncbi:MAG: metal ABC transporter ATP-binding protein [Clostridia bacterium]